MLTEPVEVSIGQHLCPVSGYNVSGGVTIVMCTLPVVAADTMALMVVTKQHGMASGSHAHTFPLILSKLSVTSGSIAGGQLVTLSGVGFGRYV